MKLGPPRLGRTTLIAVDGPSGSGKSTMAARLADDLGATVVSTDDFATWDDPVAWWPRLVDGVLLPLADGRPGRYRRTEWTEGTPHLGGTVVVEPVDILVLEGVSSGRRSIRPRLSALIWCEVPDRDERLARALLRDGPELRERLTAWQWFEDGWFAVDGTREAADHRA